MNILVIHQYFLEKNDGGGSRFNEMTRLWAAEGHQITVLAGMVHYATGKKQERYKGKWTYVEDYEAGVIVVRSHVSEAYNVNFLGRLWGYFSFVFSSVYAGLFKAKSPFDIIIVTSPPLFVGITAYVLSKIKRIPFVFEVRDLWPESAIDTGVLKNKLIINMAYWFEAFIYRKAKLINVLTPAFRDKLIQTKKVPADKVLYIPNAADFSLSTELQLSFDREAFRRVHGLDGKMVLIYVGAHGIANHLIQVVETADILRGHSDILFLLIGNGMDKPLLIEEAQKRGLQNIHFIDSVAKTEVFKYILASDIGLSVLKKVETFKTVLSNKTFDYMACRKPTLMVIDGVSRQLVEEAQCGIFVEPENPADFAQKVLAYWKDGKTRWEKEGENGYQYAKAHFDRQVLANQYIEALSSLISKKPTGSKP